MDNKPTIDFLFEHTGKGALLLGGGGIVSKVNEEACHFLSLTPEQILNQNIYELWRAHCADLTPALDPMDRNSVTRLNSRQGYLHMIPLVPNESSLLLIDSPEIGNDKTVIKKKSEENILKIILETAYDGIVVVDKDGIITMMSNAYQKFLGITTQVVGKHVTEVVPNTRMHTVLETGIPEINAVQKIHGNYMIATRIPYFIDGVLEGCIGKVLFRNLSELDELNRKITRMERKLKTYKKQLSRPYSTKYGLDSVITQNPKMLDLKKQVRKIGSSKSNITILGESGTGKELFAHAIHDNSSRADGPFVKVNCAAIPENLFESELFGHGKGAFTGAAQDKMGKFELADGGTLFLDEIGDMPLSLQAKILRALQEGEIEPLGSRQPIQVNVRVIAATHRDLKEMIRNKTFRADLFYRINVLNITIPPLRERKEDLSLISEKMIDNLNREHFRHIQGFSSMANTILMAHDWPGNVRELENVIEKAYHLLEGGTQIEAWHLPAHLKKNSVENENIPLKILLEQTEKQILVDRITAYKGNKSKAAKALGISRVTLHKKLARHNLDHL